MSDHFFYAELPLGPGINESYSSANSVFQLTEVANIFKEHAAYILANQWNKKRRGKEWNTIRDIEEKFKKKIKTPLALTLFFYRKSVWKADEDGPVKITQDVIFDYIGLNDCLVTYLVVRKFQSPQTGCKGWLSFDKEYDKLQQSVLSATSAINKKKKA